MVGLLPTAVNDYNMHARAQELGRGRDGNVDAGTGKISLEQTAIGIVRQLLSVPGIDR
jgi:hypothetical protein